MYSLLPLSTHPLDFYHHKKLSFFTFFVFLILRLFLTHFYTSILSVCSSFFLCFIIIFLIFSTTLIAIQKNLSISETLFHRPWGLKYWNVFSVKISCFFFVAQKFYFGREMFFELKVYVCMLRNFNFYFVVCEN